MSSRQPTSLAPSGAPYFHGLRTALSGASLLLAGCAVLTYGIRPAHLEPITLLPVWPWVGLGVLLALAGLSCGTRLAGFLALSAWLIFVARFTEEPRFLLRDLAPPFHSARPVSASSSTSLRIVTLNCNKGDLQAIAAALDQNPDILILQEIPYRRELREIVAQRPGWDLATTPEVAILVRGRAQFIPETPSERGYLCPALVWPARLRSATPLFVVGVHLMMPRPRDTHSLPAAWSDTLRIRALRGEQMDRISVLLSRAPVESPVIVGGDFNAAAGDRLLAPLAAHLTDAFAETGRGWPNTFTNHCPLIRIDRIWTDRRITVTAARTVATEHSDHRMVVVELGTP